MDWIRDKFSSHPKTASALGIFGVSIASLIFYKRYCHTKPSILAFCKKLEKDIRAKCKNNPSVVFSETNEEIFEDKGIQFTLK